MELAVQHYREEHTHPANRALHVLGMPFILLSIVMVLRAVQIASYLTASDFVSLLFIRNYYEYDASTLIPMGSLFLALNYIAEQYETHPFFILYCILFQCFGWSLQLIGHSQFEKNKPVFLNNAVVSFTVAPLLLYYETKELLTTICGCCLLNKDTQKSKLADGRL